MKFFAYAISFFFAVAAHAAQDQDVFKMVAILQNLNRGAEELDAAIVAWRIGNEDDFTKLLGISQNLTLAINDANTTIAGYGGLVETDTLRLEPPVNDLTHTVDHLINHLISRKQAIFAYEDGALASVVYGQLYDDQIAAGNTSATIVSKVPEDLQGVAKVLAAGIEDNLQRGAEEFACANCTSTISGAGSLASFSKTSLFALVALLAAAISL